MESGGEPGAVQLTRAAWQLTGLPDSLAHPRKLRVKGKAEEVDTVLVHAAAEQTGDIMRRLQDSLAKDEEAIAAAAAKSPRASAPNPSVERTLFA